MKATKLFAILAMALLMVAMPSQAQSRKERKAAEKAAWEARQQFIKDSTEIANKQRLDEMKKAPQEAADAKAKAEAAKAKAEAEQAKRAEEDRLKSTSKQPCAAFDDEDWFTASSSILYDESEMELIPTTLLLTLQQQLYQKIKAHYKQALTDYLDKLNVEDKRKTDQHMEERGVRIINQMVGDTYESCRETTDYPNADGKYKMYMSIKVSKKSIENNIVREINKDDEMQVRFNEQQFRKSFEKFFDEE